jgi:glycosyltransferase involved in cell wall biosynthesis
LRKYTILHTEASKGWGGQEIRIITEAEGLVKRGHRIIIAAPPDARIIRQAKTRNIEAVPLSMEKPSVFGPIKKLIHVINNYEIDIVNTHSSRDSWLASIASRLSSQKPVIIRTRHLSTPISNNPLSRIVYNHLPHKIITTGESIKDSMIERNNFNPDKIVSIPTGIDLEIFKAGKTGANIRRAFNIPARAPLIGMVSVLRSWKGHIFLLEAIPDVVKKIPNARFLIVGDGPYKDVIEEKIKEMGIERYVIMTGHREDIPEILSAIDFLVFPSYANEGVPQAVLQAFAAGKTVIASNAGSVSEVVLNNKTGVLIPPRNSSVLTKKIIELLKDKDKRKNMAFAGRKLVESGYSLEAMLNKIERLYNELMTMRGGNA